MPTATKTPPTVSEAPVDLASLRVLADHPRLAPLAAKRAALRRTLGTIMGQVKTHQGELRTLADDGSFHTSTARRTLLDHISQLERDGAAVEAELQALMIQIEPLENQVHAEVALGLRQASVPVFERLVHAMEALQEAQEAYEAACRRNRSLVQSMILPPGALDGTLRFRLANARQWLAKLQQRA